MNIKSIKIKAVTAYYKIIYRNIKIGDDTYIDGKIQLDNNGIIEIGAKCRISKWTCFKPWGGFITIGDNCFINSFCHISGNGGVKIGNDVLIATQCVLISANHRFDQINLKINKQGETRKGIIIEDNCWIGAGVKVLDGVTIGTGSVIGAGSVVTKDIPANCVAVGIPAKVIRSREKINGIEGK